MPGAAPNSADLRAQRGRQPVVVERGRAQLARQAQQLLHRLRGERAGSRAARRAAPAAPARRSPAGAASTPVSAWLTSSCRSRATRARSPPGPQHGAGACRARSASRRVEHAVERLAQADDLLDLGAPRRRGARGPRRSRRPPSRAMSCSSGAKRRRSTSPLTSTVASTAQTSRPRRRWSATASGSRCTVTVAASTVAAISSALTARTWVRSAGRFAPSSHRHGAPGP